MNDLLLHIHQIHSTPLGVIRIQKNLDCSFDVVDFCKELILKPDCKINRKGKNWYCEGDGIMITINASSYTIITAHKIRKK